MERKLYQKECLNTCGVFLGHLAPSWDHLGTSLGILRRPWDISMPILRQSGNLLGVILGNSEATLGHLDAIVGQSWDDFGAILGHLEPAWGYLGSMPEPFQIWPKNP